MYKSYMGIEDTPLNKSLATSLTFVVSSDFLMLNLNMVSQYSNICEPFLTDLTQMFYLFIVYERILCVSADETDKNTNFHIHCIHA